MDLGQESGGVGGTPCSDPEDSSQSWPELAGFKSIGNFGRLVGGTYLHELTKKSPKFPMFLNFGKTPKCSTSWKVFYFDKDKNFGTVCFRFMFAAILKVHLLIRSLASDHLQLDPP